MMSKIVSRSNAQTRNPQRMEKNDKPARTTKPSKDTSVMPAKDPLMVKSERAQEIWRREERKRGSQ